MPSDRRGRLPIPRRGPSARVLGKANGSAQGDHAQCSDRESTESFHVLLSQWLSGNRSDPFSLRRETMHQLHDECPVERAGQGPRVREAKPGERLSGLSGVPHYEHIVPDHWYPVEPDIEVDTLALIVVLNEGEQAR